MINGFRTEKVQVLADGELIEEHWVTRAAELKEVEDVMDKAAQGFSKDFRLEMKEGREIHEKLKPYGFSILIKDYTIAHGLPVEVLEVKKVEQGELRDEVFSPPKAYKRIVPGSPQK